MKLPFVRAHVAPVIGKLPVLCCCVSLHLRIAGVTHLSDLPRPVCDLLE